MADIEIKRVPRIDVKKGGSLVGTRSAINLIEGSNVTLTITDDSASNEVDVTIAAAGGSATPSDFQPAIVTGNYYMPPTASIGGSLNIYADAVNAVPIWFSHTETWTEIGVNVYAEEAGASIRLGIWANGADNLPGALLLDTGNLSLATPGNLTNTISVALTANTIYWIGHITNSDGVTCFLTNGSPSAAPWVLGLSAWDGSGSAGVYKSQAFGALPNPFGTPSGGIGDFPAIWLRKV